jgi:hypothetical protein
MLLRNVSIHLHAYDVITQHLLCTHTCVSSETDNSVEVSKQLGEEVV